MISAFSKAFTQLPEPSLRRVLIRAIIGALLIFIAIWFVADSVLVGTALFTTGWMETLADLGGQIAVLILIWILFPSVVTIIVGFFLDEAVRAVENRYYPGLPAAREQPISEVIWITVKFALLAVILNLLILPIYLILFFVPPLNLFVFYGLNGYLLGREYYELVAHRRLIPEEARRLRRSIRWQVIIAGAFIAFLMTIPFVNLLAPVVATAAMVHLFERWRQRERIG
ncbi:MAG: EI24 domain-containing protein [Proteobacteria bacterium]|nr:EI24 domain-containing protein [Pseudomonadota bacterium]